MNQEGIKGRILGLLTSCLGVPFFFFFFFSSPIGFSDSLSLSLCCLGFVLLYYSSPCVFSL
jgi:hypothetical protein